MSRYGGFRVGKIRILNDWENRRAPSSTAAAPSSALNFDYSTARGIWNLGSTIQFPKQDRNVTFAGISGAKGEVSGNIVLPAIASNQMIVLMERANSSTPPTLRAGFTNITTASITSPAARSIRLQYRVGGGGETLNTATAASYIVINGAKSVGVSNVSNTTAAAIATYLSPALSGVNTDGRSLIYTTTYVSSFITGVASPYTTITGIGGYIQGPTSSTVPAVNITHNQIAYTIAVAIEFRP